MKQRRTEGKSSQAGSGRPRDSAATASILQAAMDIAEERGFDALSVEGVAARAGVAKTTIYRRWPNVWAILMDAFIADVARLAPIEQRGSARESLAESIRLMARAFRGRQGKVLRSLLGRAQAEPGLVEAYWTRWVEPRRKLAREVIRQGVATGELRAGLDEDVVLDALYGALYHRLTIPYAPLSDGYVEALVDSVFGGLERRSGGRARK
jgi:AcrR family transcriptional regulator